MTITNAKYLDAAETLIEATLNGATVTIPADPGNRHYQEIVAEGISVAAYSAPTIEQQRASMVVSRFQAKEALRLAGLLPSVETAVAAADAKTQLAWAEAIEFRRNSPTIATLAAALSLTDEQVDGLFTTAAGVTA